MKTFIAIVLLSICASLVADPQDTQCPPFQGEAKLDPLSSPLQVLATVFECSGYLPQDAVDAADYCLNYHKKIDQPEFVFPDKKASDGAVLLDPRSSAHQLLTDAFEASGWTLQEASDNANLCLYEGNPPGDGVAGDNYCSVHTIRINYCFGSNPVQESMITRYLTQPCYDALFADPPGPGGPCVSQACGTDVSWLSLTPYGGCLPISASCVEVNVNVSSQFINCTTYATSIIDCSCFAETRVDPIDCDAIEQECCPLQTRACDNCPACGS